MDTDNLYPIQPHLGGFKELSKYYPGVTSGGEQVIIFRKGAEMSAYRFDAGGRYLGRVDRVNANWSAKSPSEQRFIAGLTGVLGWAEELGLRPATIRVRKFHSGHDSPTPGGFDGPRMAIYDQPSHFEDGDLGTEEEREATLRWWRELGAFVLFWNTTEHKLDGNGEPCG